MYYVIYSCDGKGEFLSVITPVLSLTSSFRNHLVIKKHLFLL